MTKMRSFASTIVLSAWVVGSVFALIEFDKWWIKNKNVNKIPFEYIPGGIMMFTGIIMMSTALKAHKFIP